MNKLVYEFELKDADLEKLLTRLRALLQLCNRNPDYYVDYHFEHSDINTLFIKIYKNDRIN